MSCKEPNQPFPSPGSPFIPPPVPGPHEFAIRHASLPRKMSKKDVDDAVPDVCRSSTCNGNTTVPTPTTTTTTTTTNGVALSSSPTSPNGVVSPTRASVPLSFLRSLVPRFIVSILNMPRSLSRVLPFQDPSAPDPSALPPPTPTHPACDPPDVHPHHHAHDSVSVSDPQPSLTPSSHHALHRLSTQSVTSLTSSRPAPPSPAVSRRASGLSRTSSRPVSDMSSAAPSRPVSGIQHPWPVSGGTSRPASGTVQPTTMTTPPTTTTSSCLRHPNDRLSNLVPTITASDSDPTAAEPPLTPARDIATTPALIQIRDYGFALTDPRFTGQGPHVPRANRPAVLARRLASSSGSTPTSSSSEGDNDDRDYNDDDDEDEEVEVERMDVEEVQRLWEDVVDDGANGWSGFKWGFGRAWGFGRMSVAATGPGVTSSGAGFPSRGDLDRNFGGEDEYEDMELDEESETFSDGEGEPPLLPGLYRALYAFEPEGTAEMKLDEDQLVRVVGRGGGVGWAVVVKDGLKDTGIHALVPESYLEQVRLDGEEQDA
ncbi:hypothetical protein J3R82DRAFT_3627 [Butyriboletus roseoflavus]|nr:hypothetical protein J3R82DRAFT_3627 [Butyriboletus roseoflavus]